MLIGLGALDVLVDLFMALALALLIKAIMKQIAANTQGIPVVGNVISSGANAIAGAINFVAAKVWQGIDAAVGWAWHHLAGWLDAVWHGMVANAQDYYRLAHLLANLVYSHAGLKSLVHRLTVTHDGSAARIKQLEREYHGIEAEIKSIDQTLARLHFKGIDATLRNLQDQISTVEHQTIPAINTRVGTLDGAIGDVESFLDLPTTLPRAKWLAGIVAVGLGALGLGGLSCNNFKNLLSKFGCGLGTLLNDLLGLMLAGLFLESVCEFLPLLEDAFGAVVGPITHLLNEVPLGSCEQPPKGWAQLNVAAGPTPPAQSLGSFPSE